MTVSARAALPSPAIPEASKQSSQEEPRTCREARDPPAAFAGRTDRYVYVDADGGIRTARVDATRWRGLWERHLQGLRRIGMFLVRAGHARAAVLDLDAHHPEAPGRGREASALVEAFGSQGITAYWTPSRGDRGAHVWLFFDEPGVPARDVRVFLTQVTRDLPDCEVFPTGHVDGGAVMLPYFGGQHLLDADCQPVGRHHLESNATDLVPTCPTTRWPPPYWRSAGGSAKSRAYRELVSLGLAQGGFFHHNGSLQARRGWRNKLAGHVAGSIVRRGGSFEDFEAWDARNAPPLASDEPSALGHWWRSAMRRHTRG